MDVKMKTLLEKDYVNNERAFGPDPLLYRKQGLGSTLSRNILEYKKKINDEKYIQYAIDKIALELMHFLVK